MSLKSAKIMFMFSMGMTYPPPQRKPEVIFAKKSRLGHLADVHHPGHPTNHDAVIQGVTVISQSIIFAQGFKIGVFLTFRNFKNGFPVVFRIDMSL